MSITFIGEETETKDILGFREYAINNRDNIQASSGLKGYLLTQKLLTSWKAMSREDRFEWIFLAAYHKKCQKDIRIVVRKISKLISKNHQATSREERIATAGEVFIFLATIEGQRLLHDMTSGYFREAVIAKLRELRNQDHDINPWLQNLNLTI